MLKFIKVFSFLAICAIAAIAGSNVGKAAIYDHYICREWACSGQLPGSSCYLTTNTIQTCFWYYTYPTNHCYTSTTESYRECKGTNGFGECSEWILHCTH